MTRVSIVISVGIPAARDGGLGVHAEVCMSIRVLNATIAVSGVLDRRVRPTVVVVIRRVVAVMVVVWLLVHLRSRLLLATSRWRRRPDGGERGVVTKDSAARRFT